MEGRKQRQGKGHTVESTVSLASVAETDENRTDGFVEVQVADSGKGMPPHVRIQLIAREG